MGPKWGGGKEGAYCISSFTRHLECYWQNTALVAYLNGCSTYSKLNVESENHSLECHTGKLGQLGDKSAGLVTERLPVQILAGVAGEFSSLESTFVCWLLFSFRSTPMLSQWHIKDPSHCAKSAGGRLHLNTHSPLTKRSQTGLTMLLSRHSLGTYLEMSSHATCQETFIYSHLNLLSHCGLILA